MEDAFFNELNPRQSPPIDGIVLIRFHFPEPVQLLSFFVFCFSFSFLLLKEVIQSDQFQLGGRLSHDSANRPPSPFPEPPSTALNEPVANPKGAVRRGSRWNHRRVRGDMLLLPVWALEPAHSRRVQVTGRTLQEGIEEEEGTAGEEDRAPAAAAQ